MRRFLRRMDDGGGKALDINPATLAWQQLFDARSITGVVDGGNITAWPDDSGHARNLIIGLGTPPVYRATGSTTGKPLADFNGGGKQMEAALPLIPINCDLGFTCIAYYTQDTVDPLDGGGFNAQMIGGSDISGGWRSFAVRYPVFNTPVPSYLMAAGGNIHAAVPAITGNTTHSIRCVPPRNSTGASTLYYNGALVATGATWDAGPNTTMIVSGNASINITLKGKLAFFAWQNQGYSVATIQGIERYLRRIFGS